MDTSWKRRVILLKYNSTKALLLGEDNMRGDGYYVRGGVLYIDGVVDGERVRKSTGLSYCKKNLIYIQKYHSKILNDLIKTEKPSFSAFAKQVINSGSNSRGSKHQDDLQSKFKRGIEPTFKNLDFNDIKPIMIEKWQNRLLSRYSINTVKKYRSLLKNIITKARANDLCEKDPFLGVSNLPREKKKKREVYTENEIKEIITHASGWFKAFMVTAFGTGARTGELIALKWEDVDFENDIITIKRSMASGKTKCTKTGEERTIDMLAMVKDCLRAYYKNRANDEWIFTNKNNNPFYESKNIVKYHLAPLLEELGIKYKTMYASRHSFISLMLNKGMDLMWVQMMAGHSRATTTLTHYATYTSGDETRLKRANFILNNGTPLTHRGIA